MIKIELNAVGLGNYLNLVGCHGCNSFSVKNCLLYIMVTSINSKSNIVIPINFCSNYNILRKMGINITYFCIMQCVVFIFHLH